MSEDFFGDLGRSITRATKKAATRTGSLIETTKINAQITGEIKNMEAIIAEIGSLMVRRIENGQMAEDEETAPLMTKIRAHKEAVQTYRLELAAIRGMELCPSCGELVEQGALFCPHCGAALAGGEGADTKEETADEDVSCEALSEEDVSEETDPGETAQEITYAGNKENTGEIPAEAEAGDAGKESAE